MKGNWTISHTKAVLALEKLGINKVIKYLDPKAKTAKERFESGLTADTSKFSAPMFTGAFELYRLIAKHPKWANIVTYLLDNGVAPKIAMFLPVFFKQGRANNSAVNSRSITPGYGSFDFWTTDHIKNDPYDVATNRMKYSGIHKCYTLPVKRPFKNNIKEITY